MTVAQLIATAGVYGRIDQSFSVTARAKNVSLLPPSFPFRVTQHRCKRGPTCHVHLLQLRLLLHLAPHL